MLTLNLAVYKSPQADMGYDIVCRLFLPMYTGGVEAITMHSSFQRVDESTESRRYCDSQWTLAPYPRIYAM